MEVEARLRRNAAGVLFACGVRAAEAEQIVSDCLALLRCMALAALDFESLSRVRMAAGQRQQLLMLHYASRVCPFECFVFFETLRCRRLFDNSLAGAKGHRLEALLRRLARREFCPEFVERRRAHAAFVQARGQLATAGELARLEEAKRATLLRGVNVVGFLESAVQFQLPFLGKKSVFPRLLDYCLTACFKEAVEAALGEPARAQSFGCAELREAGDRLVSRLAERTLRYRRVADEGFERKAYALFRADFPFYLDVILAQQPRLLRPKGAEPELLDYIDSHQLLWRDLSPTVKNAFLERYIVQKKLWRAWKERPEAGLAAASARACDALRNSKLARIARAKLRGCTEEVFPVPHKEQFASLFSELFRFWFLQLCSGEGAQPVSSSRLRLERIPENGP